MVNGGSPPKKRQTRSPPPFCLHLKYAPISGSDVAGNRNCDTTRWLSSEGEQGCERYTRFVVPSDASAVNPGMFISHLLVFSGYGYSESHKRRDGNSQTISGRDAWAKCCLLYTSPS